MIFMYLPTYVLAWVTALVAAANDQGAIALAALAVCLLLILHRHVMQVRRRHRLRGS